MHAIPHTLLLKTLTLRTVLVLVHVPVPVPVLDLVSVPLQVPKVEADSLGVGVNIPAKKYPCACAIILLAAFLDVAQGVDTARAMGDDTPLDGPDAAEHPHSTVLHTFHDTFACEKRALVPNHRSAHSIDWDEMLGGSNLE